MERVTKFWSHKERSFSTVNPTKLKDSKLSGEDAFDFYV